MTDTPTNVVPLIKPLQLAEAVAMLEKDVWGELLLVHNTVLWLQQEIERAEAAGEDFGELDLQVDELEVLVSKACDLAEECGPELRCELEAQPDKAKS